MLAGEGTQTFTLELASAVQPETLRDWLESAAPGDRAVYASGIDLPREAAGVVLVREWEAKSLVLLFSERDTHDKRRWRYLVEKRAASGASCEALRQPTGRELRRAEQVRKVLKILVDAARGRKKCPSHAEIAEGLGLPRTERSRQRARHLVERLEAEGTIEVAAGTTMRSRRVTILKGPWKGRKTA